MKLTRRGTVVAGVAVLAFVLGANSGARALDAVVVPAIATLAVAVTEVTLTDRPTLERSIPEPGFPGDDRTLRLRLDTNRMVSITDQLGEGIRPNTVEQTVAGDQTVAYNIELVRRGVHSIGPLSVDVRDSLGLVTKRYRYTDSESLLVYPDIRHLTSPKPLQAVTEADEKIERQEFDQLREYVPGDSLRDVHWKTSAKQQHQDDLFVVEYTHGGGEGISIAAESTADSHGRSVDAMATATASIVAYLIDRGIEVSLAVPNGQLEKGHDERHRQRMLELLARTNPGRVSMERVESADIYVLGERGRVTIEVGDGGQTISFDQLTSQEPIEGARDDLDSRKQKTAIDSSDRHRSQKIRKNKEKSGSDSGEESESVPA